MSPLNFLNLKNSEVQVDYQTDVFCRIQGAGAGKGPATRQPVRRNGCRGTEHERINFEEVDPRV